MWRKRKAGREEEAAVSVRRDTMLQFLSELSRLSRLEEEIGGERLSGIWGG